MIYIEAPSLELTGDRPCVFLAGGITNVGDWQRTVTDRFEDLDTVVLNPRRRAIDFPIHAPGAGVEQIDWEYARLRDADCVLFWFPKETLCPIALFELGATLERDVEVCIGTDPEYRRRFDVVQQVGLRRPENEIWGSLDHLIEEARMVLSRLGCDDEEI